MKVFCDCESCKFNILDECRTTAVSIRDGECLTFQTALPLSKDSEQFIFWGHLSISPDEADDG